MKRTVDSLRQLGASRSVRCIGCADQPEWVAGDGVARLGDGSEGDAREPLVGEVYSRIAFVRRTARSLSTRNRAGSATASPTPTTSGSKWRGSETYLK